MHRQWKHSARHGGGTAALYIPCLRTATGSRGTPLRAAAAASVLAAPMPSLLVARENAAWSADPTMWLLPECAPIGWHAGPMKPLQLACVRVDWHVGPTMRLLLVEHVQFGWHADPTMSLLLACVLSG